MFSEIETATWRLASYTPGQSDWPGWAIVDIGDGCWRLPDLRLSPMTQCCHAAGENCQRPGIRCRWCSRQAAAGLSHVER